MTRNSLILGAVGAALVVFAAAYLGSPYLAASSLSQAARAGDRDRLEQAVDFPAVRSSLKEELSARMLKSMGDDPAMKSNPFAAIGMLFAPALIDRVVDTYVTPSGIAYMVRSAKRPPSDGGASAPVDDTFAPPTARYAYVGLDRFRATLIARGDPSGSGAKLVFERRGLFTWKLIRIDLPLDAAPAS